MTTSSNPTDSQADEELTAVLWELANEVEWSVKVRPGSPTIDRYKETTAIETAQHALKSLQAKHTIAVLRGVLGKLEKLDIEEGYTDHAYIGYHMARDDMRATIQREISKEEEKLWNDL